MPPASPIGSTGRRGMTDSEGLLVRGSTESSGGAETGPTDEEGPMASCCVEAAGVSRVTLPLRRLRPPRRPRRRRGPSAAGLDAVAASDTTSGCSSGACSSGCDGAVMASNTVALCSNGSPGSGIVREGLTAGRSEGDSSGASPPSRTAASCALVFQSARRKRAAAVVYHFAASAFWLAVSK